MHELLNANVRVLVPVEHLESFGDLRLDEVRWEMNTGTQSPGEP